MNSQQSSNTSVQAFDLNILGDADDVAIPFTVGTPEGMYSVKVLTKNGIKTITNYNERLAGGATVQTYVMSPEGLLFIAGVGEDGFSVFDFEGVDRTKEFPFMKDKAFSVTGYYRLDQDRFSYGIHASDVGFEGSVKNVAGIYIHQISDGSEKVFPISDVGLGTLEGLQPLCLSADGKSLYVRYQGWEGFSWSSVWKLHLSDLHAEKIFTSEDQIYTYNCKDRSDLILGVHGTRNENYGWGGTLWPPTSLMLFNGATGTSKTLLTFEDKLIKDAIITPDGQSILYAVTTQSGNPSSESYDPFYDEGSSTELFTMSIDGMNSHSIGFFNKIAGMSHDGKILIVSKNVPEPYADSEIYFVLNTKDGRVTQLTTDGFGDVVACNYGQGFDCHY